MSSTHDDPASRRWQERILDTALDEIHGGGPPDLAARVVARLAAQGERVRREPTSPRPSPARAGSVLLAAAVAAATVAIAVRSLGFRAEPGAGVAVDAEVTLLAGSGEFRPAANGRRAAPPPAAIRLAAGESGRWLLHRGSRARSGPSAAMAFAMPPFGAVEMAVDSEIEVQSMGVSVERGVVVVASVTVAVVAGVVTWRMMERSETAAAGETLRLERGDDRVAQLSAANAELAKENQDLRQQLERARSAARSPVDAPAPAARAEPPEAAPGPEAGPESAALVFGDARFGDKLAGLDWRLMGEITGQMGPKLAALMKALNGDGELPAELAIEVAKLNTKLLEQLPELLESGLPGFGGNGTYTHPLVTSNILANMLDAGGQPLTTDQRDALAKVVRAYAAENQGIYESSYDLAAERLLAETAMKDRFYEESAALLTPEQRAMMFPPGSGTVDGSGLFDTGLIWSTVSRPVAAASPAEFAEDTARQLRTRLDLSPAVVAQVEEIIARHSGGQDLWQSPAERIERGGLTGQFLRQGRAAQAARVQVGWLREILRSVDLTDEQRRKLRELGQVYVPLPR